MRPQLLLTYDFPPMSGGIARWMGELARRYPQGELVVSTAGRRRGNPGIPAAIPERAIEKTAGAA